MNRRLLSVLAFAFLVALGASVVVYQLISTKIAAMAKTQPANQIWVANRTMEIGALIKDSDIRQADWAGPAPKGILSDPRDILGRGVVATIMEGEPLLDGRLAQRGAGAGLAAVIPPGKRAVAVRVNEVVGVAGFVVPGMRVDVIVSGNPPSGRTNNLGTVSKTVLQNIEVLSAGHNLQKDNEGKPAQATVVNLLVTPDQAEVLSLASNEARIQLVLRNPLDQEVAKTRGTAMGNLFTGDSMPAPRGEPVRRAAPANRVKAAVPVTMPTQRVVVPITVEVITGIKRTETKFAPENRSGAGPEAEK
jgi:pilus assembly protein CpaB